MEKDNSLLDDYVLSLTGAPRVCFRPTAFGDADDYVVRFYRRFSAYCKASHVSLFRATRTGSRTIPRLICWRSISSMSAAAMW